MSIVLRPGESEEQLANGGLLAALVAAGAGSATMGLLYAAASSLHSLAPLLTWYSPAGALSGMSGVTVMVWMGVWVLLQRAWSRRTLRVSSALVVAFGLLLLGFLLTFPPLAKLF